MASGLRRGGLIVLLAGLAAGCVFEPRGRETVDANLGGGAGSSGGSGGRTGAAPGDGPAGSTSDGAGVAGAACGTACVGEKPDGCCPAGCTQATDPDCAAQCGNGALERGEQCDPPSSCPASCPSRGCTKFTLEGSAAECTAACKETGQVTTCNADDGCCPAGCTTGNDSDCSIVCGDGARSGAETCDPLATCPTACPAEGCQLRKLVNAGTCTAECVNDRQQTACASGDGCCPGACHNNNDGDCAPKCGNGVVETGESCEPVAECTRRQTACRSDQNTVREGRGTPGQCTFECAESPRRCGDADGQCPAGCNNDPDCRRPAGAACSNAAQCLSNSCLDGVCCTESCNGCQRCAAPSGTCQPSAEPRPGSCPVPANGRAACRNGQCSFTCLNGKVPCGNACEDCCQDNDCRPGQNEQARCTTDHRCELTCRPDTTRCRGTCRPVVVLGACMASSAQPPSDLFWCDIPQNSDGVYLDVDRYRIDLVDANPTRSSNSIDQLCFNFSDDITGAYCQLGPLAAERTARKDVVQMFTVRFGADGRIDRIQNTANTKIRTCGEPLQE